MVIVAIAASLTLRDDGGMLVCGTQSDIAPSSSCCRATLPETLIVYTLFRRSQQGSPSVLSQDQDGRQLVVPSGHFLKLPDK